MNKIIAKFAFVATVVCVVAFGGSLSARADYNSCMLACGNGMAACSYTCSFSGPGQMTNPVPGSPGMGQTQIQACIASCYAALHNCEGGCGTHP
jgi:hypothetical protein